MRPMQDFGGAFTKFKPEFYIGVRLIERRKYSRHKENMCKR